MNPFKSMSRKAGALGTAAGLLALGLGFAGQAAAGCSGLAPAVYTPADGLTAGLMKVGGHEEEEDWEWGPPRAAIVGMWKFAFVSHGSKGIPDGATIDAGYVTWHSDGTELMNSGRAPLTGSFCMGVWKPLGHGTFKLNHIAMAWDPTGSVFVGPANIRETVTVDRKGNSYSGKFTLDQYATDEKTLLAHVQGTVTATRVTVE